MYFGPLTLLVYLVLPHGYLLDIASIIATADGEPNPAVAPAEFGAVA